MSVGIQGLDGFSGFVFSLDTRTVDSQSLALAARQAGIDAENIMREETRRQELETRQSPILEIDSRQPETVFRARLPSPPKTHFTRKERREHRVAKRGETHKDTPAVSDSNVGKPRFLKAVIQVTCDMTSQEVAELIERQCLNRLTKLSGHAGVAILKRLTSESYDDLVRSDPRSTGLSLVLAHSGGETKHTQAVRDLLKIMNVDPKEKILDLLFRTNGRNGHPHPEAPAEVKKGNGQALALSSTQAQIITGSIKRIVHDESYFPSLVLNVQDFLKINLDMYPDIEIAQLDLDNRISFLNELGLLIDSSGNGRPVNLEILETEYEFYALYSEANPIFKPIIENCLVNFSFLEGNNFANRLDMIDFLEKRVAVRKLPEATQFLLNIVELKKAGVRGALSLFYDASKAVNKNETETTIGGHFTELELDLSLVRNRNDVKLEYVGEYFGPGCYTNLNPRIAGLTRINTSKGITIDAGGLRTSDKRRLSIEHKSSGHALAMHIDRVINFVRFANIRNEIPVIMFSRDISTLRQNRGDELTKILDILQMISRELPEASGFTQPLIFDKNGKDITDFFKQSHN